MFQLSLGPVLRELRRYQCLMYCKYFAGKLLDQIAICSLHHSGFTEQLLYLCTCIVWFILGSLLDKGESNQRNNEAQRTAVKRHRLET